MIGKIQAGVPETVIVCLIVFLVIASGTAIAVTSSIYSYAERIDSLTITSLEIFLILLPITLEVVSRYNQ